MVLILGYNFKPPMGFKHVLNVWHRIDSLQYYRPNKLCVLFESIIFKAILILPN